MSVVNNTVSNLLMQSQNILKKYTSYPSKYIFYDLNNIETLCCGYIEKLHSNVLEGWIAIVYSSTNTIVGFHNIFWPNESVNQTSLTIDSNGEELFCGAVMPVGIMESYYSKFETVFNKIIAYHAMSGYFLQQFGLTGHCEFMLRFPINVHHKQQSHVGKDREIYGYDFELFGGKINGMLIAYNVDKETEFTLIYRHGKIISSPPEHIHMKNKAKSIDDPIDNNDVVHVNKKMRVTFEEE